MAVNLDWLATEGGKILVIVGMLVFITSVVVIMSIAGHPAQEVRQGNGNRSGQFSADAALSVSRAQIGDL